MKKRCIFYLCLSCIFPTLSNAETCPNGGNLSFSDCYNSGGCMYEIFGNVCKKCPPDTYWPQNQSCPDEEEGCNCLDCHTATYPDNAIYDENNEATDQSTCPWKCDEGFFRNNAGTHCLKCPGNGATYYNYAAYPDHSSTSDFTDMQGVPAQHINECFQDSNGIAKNPCDAGQYLIKTTASATDTQPVYFCGTCGLVSNNYVPDVFDINICPDCDTSAFVNTYYGQRGTPRVQCDCPDDSSLTAGVCKCNAPRHIVQDPDTNQSHCAQCPDNASPSPTDNTQCKCNIGFYGGNENSPCARCPNGATTDATGSTQLSDCKIKSNAKFCIDTSTSTSRTLDLTNGKHCFYLNSIPNQHNGYSADIH